eukprot:CAMPEP_0115059668 /NCGR_PEP_ID=MMETSP0227-20121206/7046_1 /TAXON_ID=89957 /ORGANISM="Polarella glacialis, Strain CCMP 1383" /LENGTH=84 /DNA_ID=CAMNT_0002444817 /DNA_START=424 /DNA_END=678 /DNA_ORIENTATION=+
MARNCQAEIPRPAALKPGWLRWLQWRVDVRELLGPQRATGWRGVGENRPQEEERRERHGKKLPGGDSEAGGVEARLVEVVAVEG